jgi:hypothetical protein
MSYIIKSTSPFVSVKLTQIGRQQLSMGKLNFSSWAIGDSEINYGRESIVDANPTDVTLSATSQVLRPFDQQPNIKTFITPNNNVNPFQAIDSSVINVVKAIVNNKATDRGPFSQSGSVFTTLSGDTYTPYTEVVAGSEIDGTNLLTVTTTTAVTIGDLVLLKLPNSSIGTVVPFENTRAMPNLWFKIQGISGSDLVLDRNLPDYTSVASNAQVIIYKGGEVYDAFGYDSTTAYWDSGTLSFDSANNVTCSDVPVWNMNNVWCESVAGITSGLYEDFTKYGSFPYLGAKYPYLEYSCDGSATTSSTVFDCSNTNDSYEDGVKKSISILHYTNNTISSLYGEFFYTDVDNGKYLRLSLPDLMYHRKSGTTGTGTAMGMDFIATGATQIITNTDIQYLELFEDSAMLNSGATAQVVGRVFPQLKTVVFHDDEIVAASSYKSNRNWTLPALSASLQSPNVPSTGVLAVNKTMYLTYSLQNSGATAFNSLPCQKYIKITNTTSGPKDVAFKINDVDLLTYMHDSVDYGFYADTFKLLYQIVDEASDRPDTANWKEYDFTSPAIMSGSYIDPTLLENQAPNAIGFILTSVIDTSATIFNLVPLLNLPANTTPEQLQFGDERLFYGNLSTYIGATIFKTIFDIRINSGQFNTTSNPTRSKDITTSLPNIKVSEIGIYDSESNLVCIGKLSTPIALTNGNTIMIELSLDF